MTRTRPQNDLPQESSASARTQAQRPLPSRLRRIVRLLRTEGSGARREAVAVGIGVFIGCLPFYGLHLLLCAVIGTLFRLNRLKMYVAANLSNPIVAPLLLVLEVQTGAWLRRGTFYPFTIESAMTSSLPRLGADLLVGCVVVGAVLGVAAGSIVYILTRETDCLGRAFADLVLDASDRYLSAGIMAWEFARAKLAGDPIYRAVVCGGLLDRQSPHRDGSTITRSAAHGGRTLLDIGCGMGLTLALLAEARRAHRDGRWPSEWPAPAGFERIVGIELRGRVARVAAAALAGEAEVVTGHARDAIPARVDAALLVRRPPYDAPG